MIYIEKGKEVPLVGYIAFHHRVESKKGKPNQCEVCGTIDKNRWYDWANLTGNYNDINDYKRMCVPCHMLYDKKRKEDITNGLK